MAVKLKAEDAEDLKVISAHLQDALVRVGDIAFMPRKRRLAISFNRFCWETPAAKVGGKDAFARISAGLCLDGVLSVKTRGIDRANAEGLLYLLAVEPKIEGAGAGTIEFVFAGNASLIADVECVDAALTDLGEPWLTDARPGHEDRPAGQR